MQTRYRRCCRCKKKRPTTSFHGRDHQFRLCRVCTKTDYARRTGNADALRYLLELGDLDTALHRALGPHWPRTLVRAKNGAYARV